MADSDRLSSPTADTAHRPSSRPKQSRNPQSSPSNVRQRSPSNNDGLSSHPDHKVPTKRARKAINCEPCRNSKLKCDRNRPCSSCVLRGTVAHCYQNQEPFTNISRTDDSINAKSIDPILEVNKMRQSLAMLESHILYNQRQQPSTSSRTQSSPFTSSARPSFDFSASAAAGPSNVRFSPSVEPVNGSMKQEAVEGDVTLDPSESDMNPPGKTGRSDKAGIYTGPTSAASHLPPADVRDSEEGPDDNHSPTYEALSFENRPGYEEDRDLLSELPHVSTIDGLIDYYFEYCNWVYRHINEPVFLAAWQRYKTGATADRIILGTVCMVMATALPYLPSDHELLRSLPPHLNIGIEELGQKFYNVMKVALQRRQNETKSYSLELVELLLLRGNYLALSKIETEEIWNVKGELITISTAMGLHRDPGKLKLPLEVAERRRWAWWHVILFERWQAFMFGRPPAIASHHFDTALPSYCDPAVDPTGRIYGPNIALFKLAYILGNIMDDAISLLPVPYENIVAKDKILQQWLDALPPELDMDDYSLVRSLASGTTAIRRLGVQSIIVRTAFLHIRFTLHRPYASLARDDIGSGNSSNARDGKGKFSFSLDTAVLAADKLIALVAQARPEILTNASLSVPGHLNWGPFHVFSAAMFFSFQLINNPDQPGARMLRGNILRAISTLEQCRGMPVAEKALAILQCLCPLYDDRYLAGTKEERERMKTDVLPRVRSLAFPYHDSSRGSRAGLGTGESPRVLMGAVSPSTGSNPTDEREMHDQRRHEPPQVVRFDSEQESPHQQQRAQPPPMMSLQPPEGHGQNGSVPKSTSPLANVGTQSQASAQNNGQLPPVRWAPVQGTTYPVTFMNGNSSGPAAFGSSRTAFMPAQSDGELTSPSSSHHASHHHHHHQSHPPPDSHHQAHLQSHPHSREGEHHDQHGLMPPGDSWRHHQVQTLLHLQGYHKDYHTERDPDPNNVSSQMPQQRNAGTDPRSVGMGVASAYGAPSMIGVGMGMGLSGAPPPPQMGGMAGGAGGMDSGVWGASSGFEQGEWALFLDNFGHGDTGRGNQGRMSMGE